MVVVKVLQAVYHHALQRGHVTSRHVSERASERASTSVCNTQRAKVRACYEAKGKGGKKGDGQTYETNEAAARTPKGKGNQFDKNERHSGLGCTGVY